jgi:tRNA U38,U39,U40 pseudouridine synthase TruA
MVKKILELGMGNIQFEDFSNLFNTTKRISYQPANPIGLILWDIKYDKNVMFIDDQKSKDRMSDYFLKNELNYSLKYNLFRVLQQNNFS